MAIGQSYKVALRYVKETTWGTTPSSNLKNLRYTTESLVSETTTQPSEDIIQERRIREILKVGTQSSGDIEFLLSYSNLDDLLEGALASTWTADTPSSGSDRLEDGEDLISFSMEKEYTDLTTPEFQLFPGCRIGSLGLSVEPDNPITATMSMLGKAGTVSESSAGTGNTAAPTNQTMVVGAHVSSVKEGGTTSSDETTDLLSFNLNLDNSLRNQRNINSLDPHNVAIGRVNVTGSIRAYFEDSSLIDKYMGFNDSTLNLIVADDSNNQYDITVHSVKYTDGQIEHQGTDGDAIVALDWQAFRDSSVGKVIRIDRS